MSKEWIWDSIAVDEERMPVWVSEDFEASTVQGYRFRYDPASDPKIFPHPSKWKGKAVFGVRFGPKRVEALSCLPPTPLIDDKLRKIVRKFVPDDEVFFYPSELHMRGGEITPRFKVLIPLISHICIDEEQCEGIGRFEHSLDHVSGWRTAKHLPNCLKGHHMVRDLIYPGHIVISDELKTALEATGDPGLAFHRIEEFQNVGYYED